MESFQFELNGFGIHVKDCLFSVAVRAEDLKIFDSTVASFVSRVDVVNVEELGFRGLGEAFLTVPTDVSEWEIEDTVEQVDSFKCVRW